MRDCFSGVVWCSVACVFFLVLLWPLVYYIYFFFVFFLSSLQMEVLAAEAEKPNLARCTWEKNKKFKDKDVCK